jgi:hypothetical protein
VGKGVDKKPLVPTQVYALVPRESEGGLEVVTSTAPILGFEASVLFDSRATNSFISIMFVRLFKLIVQTLEPGLAITTPIRKTMVCKHAVCECPISICGNVLSANLFVLPMINYDVILKMDWLARHSAIINYSRKQVKLRPWGEREVTYVGSRVRSLPPTILAVRDRKLILGGGQAFLAFVLWCESI